MFAFRKSTRVPAKKPDILLKLLSTLVNDNRILSPVPSFGDVPMLISEMDVVCQKAID